MILKLKKLKKIIQLKIFHCKRCTICHIQIVHTGLAFKIKQKKRTTKRCETDSLNAQIFYIAALYIRCG